MAQQKGNRPQGNKAQQGLTVHGVEVWHSKGKQSLGGSLAQQGQRQEGSETHIGDT